jgi:hypothetical protein
VTEMFKLPKISITNCHPSRPKRRKKRKGSNCLLKVCSIRNTNWLKRMEGFPSQGNYVAKLLTLIHVIWLKWSQLTYMAKKLMSFVMFADQGVKVNWLVIVFNILYNKLRDLSTSTTINTTRDNIEFGVAQVVDILLELVYNRPNIHPTRIRWGGNNC